MVVHERTSQPRGGTAVERVIATIIGSIASGGLHPGEQVRQEELASALGLSRVPVREALHALAEQRVLVHEKRRGFFVAKRTQSELAQFARMLEFIEEDVTSSAVWPDMDTLARLRGINDQLMSIAEDLDVAETFALNREFHFTIFQLSPLEVMVEELDRLWRLAQSHIVIDMVTQAARLLRVEEHRDIISRLEARDRGGLIEAMRRHRRRIPAVGDHDIRNGGDPAATAVRIASMSSGPPSAVRFLSARVNEGTTTSSHARSSGNR